MKLYKYFTWCHVAKKFVAKTIPSLFICNFLSALKQEITCYLPPPPYSPPPLLIGQFLYAPPRHLPLAPNKAKNNTLQLIAGNAFSTIISNMVKESANIADFEETTTFSNELKSSVWDMAC